MNALALVAAALAVVALIGLAVAYGKYRAAAKLASTWEALAKLKESNEVKLKKQLADKEAILRATEKARLANMPADAIVNLFRGMYGPKAGSGKPHP